MTKRSKSNRLTSEWTDTLEEAFGSTGAKGRLGELFMMDVFKSWGWDVKDHESDPVYQLKGIDLEFKNPKWNNYYSCDVKNNINEYGDFQIHDDWLFKNQCDRIFHVNPNTEWVAWYNLEDMRTYFSYQQKIGNTCSSYNSSYIIIGVNNKPQFVSTSNVSTLKDKHE